ncbi:MAG: AraC family transcriptional regulator [Verrucomicrobiota bacterium]|nr:AraC family transcriptional regulator [Verrucomicrobiota bacterium]
MDFLYKHLSPLPRAFPAACQVQSIGYIVRKTEWVRTAFDTINFSFILSGGGEYWRQGQRFVVEPPCVLTQTPGDYVEYGPDEKHGYWEELFLIYPAPASLHFAAMSFALPERAAWKIQDFPAVREKLDLLNELVADTSADGSADRIDRLCEALILESLIKAGPQGTTPEEVAIRTIRQHLKKHFAANPNWEALAGAHGLNLATFRRYWLAIQRVPPARYLARLRMREACRLLVETHLTVADISTRVGYDDPLYFSRKFHRELSMTATAYRARYQSQGMGGVPSGRMR